MRTNYFGIAIFTFIFLVILPIIFYYPLIQTYVSYLSVGIADKRFLIVILLLLQCPNSLYTPLIFWFSVSFLSGLIIKDKKRGIYASFFSIFVYLTIFSVLFLFNPVDISLFFPNVSILILNIFIIAGISMIAGLFGGIITHKTLGTHLVQNPPVKISSTCPYCYHSIKSRPIYCSQCGKELIKEESIK
ncbi:MAG: hypothetical protein ACFFD2_27305 [Promethearchaeota archaeon]